MTDYFNQGAKLIYAFFSSQLFFDFVLPFSFFLMIFIERIVYHFSKENRWNEKDYWANLTMSGMKLIVDLLFSRILPISILYFLYLHCRLFTLGDSFWGWLSVFVIHDLILYIDHVISHRTGLFWAFHSVHHSSKDYNITVSDRSFLFDFTLISKPTFYLMPIFGLSVNQIIIIIIFTNIYGIFQHTRFIGKMGFLEFFLATPSHHRVHHGSDIKYLDKNYGQVLILWDFIFGTFQKEEEEPVYGLVNQLDTHNPFLIQTAGIAHLWKRIKSADKFSDKLKYLYMPPGWSHSG